MNLNVEKSSVQVVCDVAGCKNVAEYFIKSSSAPSMADALKLCPECCSALLKILQKVYKKEKISSENK